MPINVSAMQLPLLKRLLPIREVFFAFDYSDYVRATARPRVPLYKKILTLGNVPDAYFVMQDVSFSFVSGGGSSGQVGTAVIRNNGYESLPMDIDLQALKNLSSWNGRGGELYTILIQHSFEGGEELKEKGRGTIKDVRHLETLAGIREADFVGLACAFFPGGDLSSEPTHKTRRVVGQDYDSEYSPTLFGRTEITTPQ